MLCLLHSIVYYYKSHKNRFINKLAIIIFLVRIKYTLQFFIIT